MMHRFVRRFARSERGSVMVETAFVLPIVVMLLLAGFEIARLTLLHQKLDRAATAMADLVSQSEDGITVAQLNDMFSAMQHIMEPFALSSNGVVIVSSISTEGANPTLINWQQSGAGSASASSQIGTTGSTPTLPSGLIVRSGEELVVSEIFYNYSPFIFWDIVTATQIYKTAYFRPRYGDLQTLDP